MNFKPGSTTAEMIVEVFQQRLKSALKVTVEDDLVTKERMIYIKLGELQLRQVQSLDQLKILRAFTDLEYTSLFALNGLLDEFWAKLLRKDL